MESTRVTFPHGATKETARVVGVVDLAEGVGHPRHQGSGVITNATPFHPLDHTWPDQPGDVGWLAGAQVVDCLTAAKSADGPVLIGESVTARRGDPGWAWLAVHVLAEDQEPPEVGQEVLLEVDEGFRHELSAAHTACHLAALALNMVAAPYWRKDPGRSDSLGHPDLDSLAITESHIGPMRAADDYRLGKSIRKKGLNSEALLGQLPELAEQATAVLREWLATGAPVTIDTDGDPTVAARRTWRCDLPPGPASYPCGGTHVASLSEIPAEAGVSYQRTDEGFRALTTLL